MNRLPISKTDSQPAIAAVQVVLASVAPSKPNVIFLDDEQNVLEGIRRSLRHMKDTWEMQYFTEPRAALDAIDRLEDAVVVTDWMMPGMDGLQFYDASRQRIETNGRIAGYFIVLTGKQGSDDVVTALERGFDDYIRKPFHSGELIARVGVGIRVLQSERELRKANIKLEALAMTDPLTELYNRRHGMRAFQEEMSRARRGKQHLSVMMADIDHFKRINDTYGHSVGDRVLTQFAAVLKYTIRNYDVAVRWGGEEFLVICPHTSSLEIGFVSDRLMGNIRGMAVLTDSGDRIQVTASIGTCSTDLLELDDAADPIGKADKMLYSAKAEGRNRIVHFQAARL